MIFSLEAWAPEYGTGGDVDSLSASNDVVHANVEVAPGEWTPIASADVAVTGDIYFVDGVRRIDARVWLTDDGLVLPGTCATVAAGSVRCTPDAAMVHDVAVRRAFFTPPAPSATSIVTEYGEYVHVPVTTGSPEDLYLGIHDQMTALETRIVPEAGTKNLVVFDGPLRGRVANRTVGLIKTHHVQYLEADEQRIVASLDAGERSPLFTIGTGRFARFSWYLRLPGPRTHGWAGIVRCEAPCLASDQDGVANAASLANLVSATLPRYASEPHKEDRAPQNLYPIKGLENALRRRLGDQRLLQRALRKASAESPPG